MRQDSNSVSERRYKLAYINPEEIINLFYYPEYAVNAFYKTQFIGLPEGYKIKNVSYDYPKHSFVVIIEHESFDPVPLHEYPPLIETETRVILMNQNRESIKDESWRDQGPLF